MDASAYLHKHGWRGSGHSLDHTDRGIKKPLLVSKKVDVLGVGLNKHQAVSDQWWLRAFDEGLKNFGSGKESKLAAVQKHGVNRGDLYGRFVKGEGVPGSFENSTKDSTSEEPEDTDSSDDMAVDIPPEDKLERVVAHHKDPNHHDAMMHLLQNPQDAPMGMQKMLDKKRRRAERPVEKRARRKTERSEKTKESTREKRAQEKAEGTFDEVKEQERRAERELNRQADAQISEAQKRGILPAGPNEVRKGLVPTGANAEAVFEEPSEDFIAICKLAGLDPLVKFAGYGSKSSTKAEKYTRERLKREFRRAAKSHLAGEKLDSEQTREERQAAKAEKKEKKRLKEEASAQGQAERLARREEKAAQKKLAKASRKAEKDEISRLIAEKESATVTDTAARTNEDVEMQNGNDFETGADEVMFGINSKGGQKTIPGVGAVDSYPTKAEKKAKKLKAMAIRQGVSEDELLSKRAAENAEHEMQEKLRVDRYRALKHGMSLEDYQQALLDGTVHVPKVEKKNIDPEKLQDYTKRAHEKGISVGEYIHRREEKHAAKQAEKLGNPYQREMLEAVNEGEDVLRYDHPSKKSTIEPPTNGFIVDTAGDDSLAVKPNGTSSSGPPNGLPLAIIDTEGDATAEGQAHMPIPLDPRVWQDIPVKDMSKAMRKARQQWMKNKREEKKARERNSQNITREAKKPKGQRKVEAREAFVKQILFQSRKALAAGTLGSEGGNHVTIEGVEGVPLVRVATREGVFKKQEVGLARTVARRVLRNVKREERAKVGKGKGFKKRERSEKEAARNAGISGFTDRARLEEGYRGEGMKALLS